MTQTATNPGLQAALEAYRVLHDACQQTAKFLRDHAYGAQVVTVTSMQLGVLYQNLAREMSAADKVLDGYVDEALNGHVLEQIIDKHLGPDGIETKVAAMDIDAVVAYARENDIGDWDTSTWTDDMWTEKESELRAAVVDHMMKGA